MHATPFCPPARGSWWRFRACAIAGQVKCTRPAGALRCSGQLNTDRPRRINALTALLRAHDLGPDARGALTASQPTTVAGCRRREEWLGVGIARAEAVRLAKRILVLDEELSSSRADITTLLDAQALGLPGVGRDHRWLRPSWIAGTCPIPASSATVQHRLNRGGDRRLHRAQHHRPHSKC